MKTMLSIFYKRLKIEIEESEKSVNNKRSDLY